MEEERMQRDTRWASWKKQNKTKHNKKYRSAENMKHYHLMGFRSTCYVVSNFLFNSITPQNILKQS